jgi:hypothetical protein
MEQGGADIAPAVQWQQCRCERMTWTPGREPVEFATPPLQARVCRLV